MKIIVVNTQICRGRNFSIIPLCEWADHSCPNLKTNHVPGKSNQNVIRRSISGPPLIHEILRCQPLPLEGQGLHPLVSGAWAGFQPPTHPLVGQLYVGCAWTTIQDSSVDGKWIYNEEGQLLCVDYFMHTRLHTLFHLLCTTAIHETIHTKLAMVSPFYIKSEAQRVCITYSVNDGQVKNWTGIYLFPHSYSFLRSPCLPKLLLLHT